VGLKVPVPTLSSVEENSLTKKVGDENLSSDSKGGILEKFTPGQMQYTPQPMSLQNEDLEKSNGELKVDDEGTRLSLKLQQEALDRREKDAMGISLGIKPSDDMSSVPPLMKVMVKEEMESSNDELSNVQMPLPSGGLVLKDEVQSQNSQHMGSLSNQMESIIGTSNQNIKLEPGVLREQQASPMELSAGSQQLSPPAEHLPMQMPPNMSLTHHSGRSSSPILQVPSHHPHLVSGSGPPSIIRQATDVRGGQSSDMRQQISDARQSTDIRQAQDMRGGVGQGSDGRQPLGDMRPGLPSDVRQTSSDVRQQSDIQQITSGGLGLEKPLSQMSGGSYSDDDRERDSKSSQSLQIPPVSMPNSSQALVLQHQGLHQAYSYLPGSPYHHHQRSMGGEKSMGMLHVPSLPPSSTLTGASVGQGQQNEPQNLKIKQELIAAPDQVLPPSDPLQSLKEVKIPGYSASGTSASQPLPSNSMNSGSVLPVNHPSGLDTSRPPSGNASTNFLGPSIDNIKKEPENYLAASSSVSAPGTNLPAGTAKSPPPKHPASSQPAAEIDNSAPISSSTPPLTRISSSTPPVPPPTSQPPVSHSAANHISPSPTTARLTPTDRKSTRLNSSH
jgi:hypothetical protein